jgi:hypothetical protein
MTSATWQGERGEHDRQPFSAAIPAAGYGPKQPCPDRTAAYAASLNRQHT